MKAYSFKRLAKPVLVLAVPIMLQGVLMNLMGFVDAVMIGQLGESVISALGNSQQLMSFIFLLVAAISIGGSVLIAQYVGAANTQALQRCAIAMVQAGFVFGCAFGLLLFFYGEFLISILTTDLFRAAQLQSSVPKQAAQYLNIVAFAIPAMLLGQMLTAALNSVGDTKTPVKIGISFNVLNFALNYLLIFGGTIPGVLSPLFTPLGFKGAAYATLIAANGQFFMLFWLAKRKNNGLDLSFSQLLLPTGSSLKRIIKIGYPNSVDGFYWQGARVFYTVLMNAIGAVAYAAYTIVRTLKSLFMLPIGGLQTATAIRIGHLLGAGHFKRAQATATVAVIVGMLIMVIPASLLIVFAKPLLSLYAIAEETARLALYCTWVLAGSLFFTAVNAVIPGLLRAGGEAPAVMRITLVSFIFCGAPLSWLLGIYFQFGLIGAFVAISFEEVFKAFLFFIQMKKMRWLTKLS